MIVSTLVQKIGPMTIALRRDSDDLNNNNGVVVHHDDTLPLLVNEKHMCFAEAYKIYCRCVQAMAKMAKEQKEGGV